MLGAKNTALKSSHSNFEEMLKSGVHFGYSRSRRHPKMKQFLFGIKNNVEIFNLEKTKQKLDEAKEFLKNLGKENKKIIFVGTKIESRKLIENFAKEISALYVNERWIGGTLTNFKTVKNRINYLNDLIKKKESGELEKYTKKEQLQIEKEISKLQFYFQGLQTIEDLPSALVVIDSKKEKNAIMETRKVSIPVVAIMNSDCNPDEADYPIPSNDNSKLSIEYILKELIESYKEGMKTKK